VCFRARGLRARRGRVFIFSSLARRGRGRVLLLSAVGARLGASLMIGEL